MQGRCDLGEKLITFLGSEIAQVLPMKQTIRLGSWVGIGVQRQFIGS